MKKFLILTMLAGVLGTLISKPALAQIGDPVTEAVRLNKRCGDLQDAGRYDEALEPCQSALAMGEKVFGSKHPIIAVLLTNLAELYRARGDYEKAEPLYLRAVGIKEDALGREHSVAISLGNLASLYFEKGDYAKAEPLYLRALAIDEKAVGSEHPDFARDLNNLAELYRARGDYRKAEPMYQRALRIKEKALGSDHPSVATSLNNLGSLYLAKGDYEKAEPLYLRSLRIKETALGSNHPDVANILNQLAALYYTRGEYAKAELLYRRALAIYEKTLGSDHPSIATSLSNLGSLYLENGEYENAEPLYRRALAIRMKALGREHPKVADSLNDLASLYYEKGDYAQAEPLYQFALGTDEKALGSEHASLAIDLTNLAGLYEAKGDYTRAVELQMRAQEIRERNINAIIATGSENQKQLYLDALRGDTDGVVSLHAHSAPTNAQAAQLALTTIERRKGRALDAMTDQIAGLRQRATSADVKLLDALTAAQSQLATLQLSNETRLTAAERRVRVKELETEIEKLQDDIGLRSAEFRARNQSVTLAAVRQAIPTGAVLIEIFAYRPFNTKAKSIYERYGKPRYVAYVLKPKDDVPGFVDLGEVEPIDTELRLWRTALLDPERTDVRALGRRVDERVMYPIRKLLGDAKFLLISPDGALNLIPFAALVDENNRFLVETYTIGYLTSGRDLLRLQVRSENTSGSVILANPTYNLTGQPLEACQRARRNRAFSLDPRDASVEEYTAAERDFNYRGIDFTQLCYPPLTGTTQEATGIKAVLKTATVLTDKRATETALKAVTAPSILHIATHGFFLADQPPPGLGKGRQLERPDAAPSGTQQENPMLRSGLILAGVNQKQSGGREDGVLTAQEAAGLNLFGTKLVVLSACETGLGDVRNGAGVYGLRRALVLAGSETQMMSLWQVSDTATRDLMIAYYTRLQAGGGRIAAMHQVQLAMLRGTITAKSGAAKADWRHPYYWAAFIPSGAWTTLDGKEPK